MIRTQRKEINEFTETKYITKETWIKYFRNLHSGEEKEITMENIPKIVTDNELQIEAADVRRALQQLKNIKSPGQNNIHTELLKYGGQHFDQQLTNLFNQIFQLYIVPDEWRTSTTILMFEKRDKKIPGNYRDINLLSTVLKLITKIIIK